MLLNRTCVLGGVALLASGALTQTPGPSVNDCLRRTILVSVVDNTGKPVMNLDRNNFKLRSKALAAKVLAATPQKHAPRAMLAMDISGSMLDPPEKAQVVQALALGIINAAGDAPLALVTFSEQINDRLDFSTPKDTLVRTVQGIRRPAKPTAAKGRQTAILDSLVSAAVMFAEPQSNDIILLITDGGDNQSRTQLSRLEALLLENGVRVFSLVLADPGAPAPVEATWLGAMTDLSRETGGQELTILPAPVTSKWDASQTGLADAKANGKYMYALAGINYRIDIEVDRVVGRAARLRLEAVASNGKELPGLRTLYPHELLPCREPSGSANSPHTPGSC